MGIEELGLQLYRQTVKRLRPAHVASHWFMTHAIIPSLERAKNFKTIPDDPFWFRLELLRDKHEPETTQLFERIVQPGMTVLDIGAHVGYYSRKFAQKVGENGRIISFEPHPKTYQTLQQNISRFSNITTYQVALAEMNGQAELHDYLVMSASGSLNYDPSIEDLQKSIQSKQDVAPRLSDDFQPKTYIVQTRPVDDCLKELNINAIDLIKMDIEGAELGALRGMRQTIQNSANLMLVMEYNPQALQGFGHDPVSALFEVMEMGFSSLQAIEPDGSLTNFALDRPQLEEITAPLMKEMGVLNVFLQK
ncbi:MAG: FkbM family methyltransferase [Chloroflexota bacterium]